ncbi:MAG: YggS family pyridoxal phosphate-dependent enzyme [Planctomycetota bacterium]|jgi:hypothetical protein|nr:YggS family pyridoxal phosphate-dependent enzyme [Planctomycetota bacterium]
MSTTPEEWAVNLSRLRDRISLLCERSGRDPETVTILPITKSLSRDSMKHIGNLDISDVGENRVLEGLSRRLESSSSFRWHMVGHVQTNKVKKLLDWVDVLHSLDRISLLESLEKELGRRGVHLSCYLQINVSGESSKGGFVPEETGEILNRIREEAPHIDILGLMTMAPLGGEARPHFRTLRELADRYHLSDLSMGMSGDYETAIEEGATCVRIGGAIFR